MREMKDSGIEWIGKIPRDWTVSKQKYANQFFNGDRGKNYPSGNDLVDEGIIFLTSNNLHDDILDTSYENSKYITEERYNILGGAKLKVNDIVFCLRGSVGNCSINKTETQGTVASSLMTIRPQKVNADFLNYMLHSEVTYSQTRLFVNGSCAENLSAENVANYYFVEPPLSEQQRIARYLNHKCANINSILSDIKHQIEVLQEYKQSVITEAVTKGLDKNVAMKDSDIEWIPQIPVTWSATRIGYSSWLRARLGWKGLKAEEYKQEGYCFLSAFNIINDRLNWENLNFIDQWRYDESPEIKLRVGDVLLVKDGAGIGKCARVDELPYGEATANGSLAIISTNDNLNYKYLHYYFLSCPFQNYIQRIMNGMGVPHLSQEELRKIVIPLPSIEEQEEISSFLDEECIKIDSILTDKQKQLDTLSEYKKSLIYEYVTGKKEVPVDA